jgi:hypothetical protein
VRPWLGLILALIFDWPDRIAWIDLLLGGLFVLIPAVIYARLRLADGGYVVPWRG